MRSTIIIRTQREELRYTLVDKRQTVKYVTLSHLTWQGYHDHDESRGWRRKKEKEWNQNREIREGEGGGGKKKEPEKNNRTSREPKKNLRLASKGHCKKKMKEERGKRRRPLPPTCEEKRIRMRRSHCSIRRGTGSGRRRRGGGGRRRWRRGWRSSKRQKGR